MEGLEKGLKHDNVNDVRTAWRYAAELVQMKEGRLYEKDSY